VITQEPPAADHPIIRAASELDNLIVSPHTACQRAKRASGCWWKSKPTLKPFSAASRESCGA